ncbi:MAG: type 4a pilus biogenesis protein PilO [Patescibacteria group bacterium]
MNRYIRRFLRLYEGFVVSGAIILFGIAAVVFGVIPGIGATVDLYGRMGELQKETDALSGKLAYLQSLDEESLRGQFAVLLSVIPQEKSVSTIVETIDGLVARAGVHITDMMIAGPGSIATGSGAKSTGSLKVKGVPFLPFSLNISGSYDQIQNFFGLVNQVRRLFTVENFDLSIVPSGETQARIALGAYYQPLPTKLGNVKTPVLKLSQIEVALLEKLSSYQDLTLSSAIELTPVVNDGTRDPFRH